MTRTMLKLPGIQPGVALNPCFGLPIVKRALTRDGGPTSFPPSSVCSWGFSRLVCEGACHEAAGDAPITDLPPQLSLFVAQIGQKENHYEQL
jgi:hypothetical protein